MNSSPLLFIAWNNNLTYVVVLITDQYPLSMEEKCY